MDVVSSRVLIRLHLFDGFSDLSLAEKSPERSVSTPRDLERSFTSVLIFFVNDLSASGNLPLIINCAAIEFAVMGQVDGLDDHPISLLIVCQAHRLEWVKVIDSTISIHRSLLLVLSRVRRSVVA